jgi:hypothetical protein
MFVLRCVFGWQLTMAVVWVGCFAAVHSGILDVLEMPLLPFAVALGLSVGGMRSFSRSFFPPFEAYSLGPSVAVTRSRVRMARLLLMFLACLAAIQGIAFAAILVRSGDSDAAVKHLYAFLMIAGSGVSLAIAAHAALGLQNVFGDKALVYLNDSTLPDPTRDAPLPSGADRWH